MEIFGRHIRCPICDFLTRGVRCGQKISMSRDRRRERKEYVQYNRRFFRGDLRIFSLKNGGSMYSMQIEKKGMLISASSQSALIGTQSTTKRSYLAYGNIRILHDINE